MGMKKSTYLSVSAKTVYCIQLIKHIFIILTITDTQTDKN